MTSTECEVLNNLIGVFIDSTPPDEDLKYHPEICTSAERFAGNETSSLIDPLVVPCSFGEVSARCPPSACHTVPFDCSWCGEG